MPLPTLLISTTPSNNARHLPPPADGSLYRAVLGQWLHRLVDNLDAVAPRVSPLVALVAGQVQVARGGPSQGEGSLLLGLQLLPGHLQPLYLVLGAPGYCSGDKSHVLNPDPVLQSCRNGVGRREEQELVRQLPCPLWSLPAPGFRVGAKDKARLSVSLASHLSPKNVPNLSCPSTAILASPRVSYLPHPNPPCSGHCGCGRCPVCSPEPGFHIFWQHQSGTLS